jgi:hypothetical protein
VFTTSRMRSCPNPAVVAPQSPSASNASNPPLLLNPPLLALVPCPGCASRNLGLVPWSRPRVSMVAVSSPRSRVRHFVAQLLHR